MASQLRVDEIIASTGSSVAIGTAGGSVTLAGDFTVDTSKGLNVGTGATIFSPSSNVLTLGTNSDERVRIDSSGRVLIGTTTAGYADLDDLTISTSGNTGITIRSGTSSLGVIGFADGTSGNTQYRGVIQYSHSDDFMQFNTADVERLRITSAGTVKIGSNTLITPSTDADNFVIDTGDVDSGLSILSATTGRIYFGDAASTDQGSIRYVHTDDSMRFETNSSEKLRITSGGDITFGETSTTANSSTALKSINAGLEYWNGTAGDYRSIKYKVYQSANSNVYGFGISNNLLEIQSQTNIAFFAGHSGDNTIRTERLRIKNNGNVEISNGNLEFSTSGKGIDFSATGGPTNGTGTSELLDDYEEGTATLNLSATGATYSMAHNTVRYVKIGRSVTVSGFLQCNGRSGTPSGNLAITGLPFTKSGNQDGWSGFSPADNLSTKNKVYLAAGTTMDYAQYNDATLVSAVNNGWNMPFLFTYQTDA